MNCLRPLIVQWPCPGVHARLRHVVRQPPVGGAARLGEAMGHQELRLGQVAGKPFILQMLRGKRTQQHGDLPVLHQLVGQPGVTACEFGRDDREGLCLGGRVQPDPAVPGWHSQATQAGLVGLGQDLGWQPAGRVEPPFPFPVGGDEGPHHLVDVAPAGVPHQALLVRQVPVRDLTNSVHRTLSSHSCQLGTTVPRRGDPPLRAKVPLAGPPGRPRCLPPSWPKAGRAPVQGSMLAASGGWPPAVPETRVRQAPS
jgi:hypothetical protein